MSNRSARRVLGPAILSLVCLSGQIPTGSLPLKKPEPLTYTLMRAKRDGEFRINIMNHGVESQAVSRYRPLYEVRVFEANGSRIADDVVYLRDVVDLGFPMPKYWLVLEAQDSVSFTIFSHDRKTGSPLVKLPTHGWAECRLNQSYNFKEPNFVKESRASVPNWTGTAKTAW